MTTTVDLALHSYSCRLRYLHDPGYDVFAFIDDAATRGFTGVNISLSGPDNDWLPPNRHLSGEANEHLDAVATYLRDHRMTVELDTDTVEPGRLTEAIEIAGHLGAEVLRTFTHHPYGPDILTYTIRDLRDVLDTAVRAGVIVAVENHEEFTSAELVHLVTEIDHPCVRLLFDYGNSLPVLEPPHNALATMQDHIVACHMKDAVLVRAEHSPDGVPVVMGVPLGQGSLDLVGLSGDLLAEGLRRFCLQNVWAYHVPLGKIRPVDPADPRLGGAAFPYTTPPFDPARIAFHPEHDHTSAELIARERHALDLATTRARRVLDSAGATPLHQPIHRH